MKIELTDKEVQRVGYNRYYNNKKMNITLAILIVGASISITFLALTDGKINEALREIIGAAIVICSFIPFCYHAIYKAEKEGKKFLKDQKDLEKK